ncbi:hypothetical protein [Candidatus Pelagibacter sp. HIMB1593]|uniref:hypothetical protein n=1 Tax=Candidatus Pelagibacter sp. HIMB1593 TaxID=3413355 RepID=UPI003F865F16
MSKKIYLNFGSYKLLDKKNDILPLSGYENSKILLCLDENNKPIYFNSDANGFNNSKIENIDTLLIGDSYVQGMCVDNNFNLNQQFKKLGLSTLSFGVGGNGPLLEYATFKEYKFDYKVKNIFLFITPENDFYDLSKEKNNQILIKYLNDENYKQNLSTKNNRDKKVEVLNEYFGNKAKRLWNDFFSVYHLNLKQVGNLIELFFKKKQSTSSEYLYLQNKKIDKLFIKILNQFINETDKNNLNFYVVFNSLTPDILYAKTLEQKKFKKLVNDKISMIKSHLKKQNISFFDYSDYLIKNYDEKNILNIFKNINNKWDHYTNKGYAILTKEAVALIK